MSTQLARNVFIHIFLQSKCLIKTKYYAIRLRKPEGMKMTQLLIKQNDGQYFIEMENTEINQIIADGVNGVRLQYYDKFTKIGY